ncbi:MAG: glycosyltransferase [Aquificae bacterium]|nr:glycosyltransferase [Aquificota bacterium]
MMLVLPSVRFSTALREDARKKIEKLKYVDIVVGIPSYFSQDTIAYVIQQVARGLERYFPDKKSLIFVSDGGSTDDTREVAQEVDVSQYNIEKIVTIYRGIPGKGSALRAVFEAAEFLKAQAVATFDSDLRSITPEWVKNIIEPIYDEFDYVCPYYKRWKFDGTITNTIAYNLTRALYGKRIRQPIGGDFGMSSKLVKDYLDKDVWETEVAKFGIDIWMTTTAIVENYNICQARLGAKIHQEKDPSKDLSDMYREVVGTIFRLMEQEKYEAYWKKVRGSEPVPIVGKYVGIEPEPFDIDRDSLIEYFRIGYNNFSPIWKSLLEKQDFKVIERLFTLEDLDEFIMPIDTWVRIVYRYAYHFHITPRQKFKLLNTMIPLYNAKVASIYNELKEKTTEEAEEYYEKQAQRFEDMKDYLLKLWK